MIAWWDSLRPFLGLPHERTRWWSIAIVRGWPEGTKAERGHALGMKADESVQQVIDDYIMDFLQRQKVLTRDGQ